MTNSAAPRPAPFVDDPVLGPYWEGTRSERMRIQRCPACGTHLWPPRPVCSSCWQGTPEWIDSGGRGTVHTFTVVRHAFTAPFRDRVPYIIAVVDLEEGVRIVADMPHNTAEEIAIGTPVTVGFRPLLDGARLPFFVVA